MLFGFVSHLLYDIATVVAFVSLSLRIVLGCVFLVSGTGKLWDLRGTRQALSDFGVPDAFTHQGSRIFPGLELLVGFGLFFDATYRLAAAGASTLSVIFVLGIANLLRQGRTPPCHCFGVVQSAPVGPSTLIRAMLLAVAGLACAGGPSSTLTPSIIAHALLGSCALLVISSASNLALWKKLNPIDQNHKILDVGQRLPALRLFDGEWLNDVLTPQIRNLIIITTPGCGPCKELKPHFNRWRKAVKGCLRILELETSYAQPKQDDLSGSQKRYISHAELGRLASGTPSALLVDDKGVLLSAPVVGSEQIEALLRVTLRELD